MFNKYPYTDFHELNLDWIIFQIKKIHAEWTEYQVLNHIIFKGIWNIAEQYPAWSIVTNNNIGYVSIKPVPAGILISDTNYWIKIFDINNLLADDSKIVLGDSYGDSSVLGIRTWSQYVEDAFPDANIFCKGGSGFASDYVFTFNFLTNLQSMTIEDPELIKDIFIFGGANDGNLLYDGTITEQNLIDRIIEFCNYVKNTYPNATVYIGWIGWYKRHGRFEAYKKGMLTYKKAASLCTNATYISGLESIMKNDDFINGVDLIHPTLAGGEELGEYIVLAMQKKSNVNYQKIYPVSFTLDAGITNLYGFYADSSRAYYDGDICKIRLYGVHNTNSDFDIRINARNFAYGDVIKIGRLNDTPRSGNLPFSQAVSLVPYPGGTVCPGLLFIDQDGDISLKVLSPTSLSNINQILLISPIDIECLL